MNVRRERNRRHARGHPQWRARSLPVRRLEVHSLYLSSLNETLHALAPGCDSAYDSIFFDRQAGSQQSRSNLQAGSDMFRHVWTCSGRVRTVRLLGKRHTFVVTSQISVNPYRLPRTALPERYDLTLSPDLDRRDFVGSAAIGLMVTEPLAELVCNTCELEIHKAWVIDAEGVRMDATPTLNAELERATFALERTLKPGKATLHIQFGGKLNEKLVGFYASTYEAADGTTKVIATTQMEATDARKAFPCWDEPDCKAVFGVTLIVEDGLLAISNMHEVDTTTLASGKRSVRFADTPKMSTYLVAFVVGELEATEPVNVDGIPLRVIARPGALTQSAFALECGAFALRYFQQWYGIPYPGTKLDLIATPDFAFGAMENLGAVTFRETLLLLDEAKASKTDLVRAADVISHEIAHMWFGDLVTMKWWNGLWLNEAFATFAEVSCCAKFKPEWDRWTSFARYRSMAQDVDGLLSTRPIEFPVISPSDAEGMFDVLTYEKGGSVLRMLEQYLGEDRFRDGVREYLRTHSFDNAETTDLWDAIERVTNEPVRSIMDGWIFQGGFPIVSASLSGTTLTLSQRPFTYLKPDVAQTASWQVPVLFRTTAETSGGASTDQRVLIGSEPVSLQVPAGTTTVVINSGGHGFYRTSYDATLLAALKSSLGKLSAAERFQLVSDAWANVDSGAATPEEFVSLSEAFGSERDPNVWAELLGGLSSLESLSQEPQAEILRARVRELLRPISTELGWTSKPDENPQTKELRGQIIAALGGMAQDADIQAGAASRLPGVLAHDGSVDPDVAPAIISICARTGDAARYEQYVVAGADSESPQEERRFLFARSSFQDQALVARTLAACLTDEIRTQDSPYVLSVMLGNSKTGPTAWEFIKTNWATINERFPANSIPRMMEGIVNLVDPSVADSAAEFLTVGPGKPLVERSKSVVQHLERQRVKRALRDRVHQSA
jgi:puromycin-sensitive aminopeptidase